MTEKSDKKINVSMTGNKTKQTFSETDLKFFAGIFLQMLEHWNKQMLECWKKNDCFSL